MIDHRSDLWGVTVREENQAGLCIEGLDVIYPVLFFRRAGQLMFFDYGLVVLVDAA